MSIQGAPDQRSDLSYIQEAAAGAAKLRQSDAKTKEVKSTLTGIEWLANKLSYFVKSPPVWKKESDRAEGLFVSMQKELNKVAADEKKRADKNLVTPDNEAIAQKQKEITEKYTKILSTSGQKVYEALQTKIQTQIQDKALSAEKGADALAILGKKPEENSITFIQENSKNTAMPEKAKNLNTLLGDFIIKAKANGYTNEQTKNALNNILTGGEIKPTEKGWIADSSSGIEQLKGYWNLGDATAREQLIQNGIEHYTK